jgi:hypothetical protein
VQLTLGVWMTLVQVVVVMVVVVLAAEAAVWIRAPSWFARGSKWRSIIIMAQIVRAGLLLLPITGHQDIVGGREGRV